MEGRKIERSKEDRKKEAIKLKEEMIEGMIEEARRKAIENRERIEADRKSRKTLKVQQMQMIIDDIAEIREILEDSKIQMQLLIDRRGLDVNI